MADEAEVIDAVLVTVPEIAEIFTEWDRRFREDPDAFESEVTRILKGVEPKTYGESCAPYFLELLTDLRERQS